MFLNLNYYEIYLVPNDNYVAAHIIIGDEK